MDAKQPTNDATKGGEGATLKVGRPLLVFDKAEVYQARQNGISWATIAERLSRRGQVVSDETLRRHMVGYVPPVEAEPATAPVSAPSPRRPNPASMDWSVESAIAAAVPASAEPVPEKAPLGPRELEHLRWLQEVHGTDWVRQHHPDDFGEFMQSRYNLFPDRAPDEHEDLRKELIANERAGATAEVLRLRKELLTTVEVPARELRLEPHDPACSCEDCQFARQSGYSQCDGTWVRVSESRVPRPEPPTEIPPMPEKPPLELSKAEREGAVKLGWLWSIQLQEWFWCKPSLN
jgi:hypothetical protein